MTHGQLLPWFITVSNIDSPDPDVVRAGNERVVRPRLADAAFFWEQDRKQPLARATSAVSIAVTFQAQLGSLGARTRRIAVLAQRIAAAPSDAADVAHDGARGTARQMRSADGDGRRVSGLQGIMGRYYALADGEPPRGGRGDPRALPAARRRRCAARLRASATRSRSADKLDTLAGIFAIGQKPSGTRDPFGAAARRHRRAAHRARAQPRARL